MLWMSRTFFNLFKPLINSFLKHKWDNNWNKAIVQFEVDSKKHIKKDVRETFKCVSSTLENTLKELAESITKDCKNDDEKAFAIFEWIVKNIHYVSDLKNYYKREFWASPDETYCRRTGDCEDGTILTLKLMELAGIPAFRRKASVGDTTMGYHAYPIYLRELHNQWFVLDWCLYPALSLDAWYSNIPHNMKHIYKTIDFTFNEVFSWAQHDLTLSLT